MEIISTIGLITINATLFHQLVAFLILMFVMDRIMFRPLRGVMSERESLMDKIRLDTADAVEEFEELTHELNAREAAARTEAHEVRQELEVSGNQEAAGILDATRQEIEALKAKAEIEIEAQVSETRKELQQESEALAVNIMEKLLDRRLVP